MGNMPEKVLNALEFLKFPKHTTFRFFEFEKQFFLPKWANKFFGLKRAFCGDKLSQKTQSFNPLMFNYQKVE
jgi:hypothetical protein